MNNLLFDQIRKLIIKLILRKKKEYNRFLSIPDYFIDRWERAKYMGFGEGSSVYDSCLVLGDVSVGKNVWIGPCTVLDGTGGLTIGNDCQIAAGAKIYTHDNGKTVIDINAEFQKKPVVIEDNVVVGSNTVVSMGVHIGNHVLIAPNSYVVRDIPSYSKVFGSPARIFENIEKPKAPNCARESDEDHN